MERIYDFEPFRLQLPTLVALPIISVSQPGLEPLLHSPDEAESLPGRARYAQGERRRAP